MTEYRIGKVQVPGSLFWLLDTPIEDLTKEEYEWSEKEFERLKKEQGVEDD